jgi:DNA-binding TFAR19-related protein (PDSD5 family)
MVSEAMDQRLPLRKRLAIRLHISMCALCRRYEKQLQLVREGTLHYANPEENIVADTLTPSARERLKRALDQQS